MDFYCFENIIMQIIYMRFHLCLFLILCSQLKMVTRNETNPVLAPRLFPSCTYAQISAIRAIFSHFSTISAMYDVLTKSFANISNSIIFS